MMKFAFVSIQFEASLNSSFCTRRTRFLPLQTQIRTQWDQQNIDWRDQQAEINTLWSVIGWLLISDSVLLIHRFKPAVFSAHHWSFNRTSLNVNLLNPLICNPCLLNRFNPWTDFTLTISVNYPKRHFMDLNGQNFLADHVPSQEQPVYISMFVSWLRKKWIFYMKG